MSRGGALTNFSDAMRAVREIEADAHYARANYLADNDGEMLVFRLRAISEKAASAAKELGGER